MNKGDACWSAGLMKRAATQDSITLLYFIVIFGNLRLCCRTRRVRQFRDWSDTRDGASRRFPTPALSLGERVNSSLPGEQSRPLVLPWRNARCSLSPRERVRVRGKKPPRRANARRSKWLQAIPDSKPPALPEVADLLRPIRSLCLKCLQRNFIT